MLWLKTDKVFQSSRMLAQILAENVLADILHTNGMATTGTVYKCHGKLTGTGCSVRHGRQSARPTMSRDVSVHVPRSVCKMIINIA
jgi:hypothetical protein